MSTYVAPSKDMQFVMRELAGLARVVELAGYQQATPDVVDAILEEAGRFAGEVLGTAPGLASTVVAGGASGLALAEMQF